MFNVQNTGSEFKYLFGPVASRRLGLSLGVDIVPPKTCSYDCIYCELGRTTRKQVRRESFFPPEEIITELRDFLSRRPELDYITFGGSGEPTLNRDIGTIIREVKRLSGFPVAVLTNGSLLWMEDVQQDLMDADVVIPSLDAASEDVFRIINRPTPALPEPLQSATPDADGESRAPARAGLQLEQIIRGIIDFTRKFAGEVWLEILFCKSINDSPEEVEHLARIAATIAPKKVQLTTVHRPPAESFVQPVSRAFLEAIRPKFGTAAEVPKAPHRSRKRLEARDIEQRILALVRRRPTPVSELALSVGISRADALKTLESLRQRRMVEKVTHQDEDFYTLARLGGIGSERREAGD